MGSITVNVNVNELPKDKIVDKSYTDRSGNHVKKLQIRLQLIPVKKPTHISDTAKGKLMKTHFLKVFQDQTEQDEPTIFCGEGVTYISNDDAGKKPPPQQQRARQQQEIQEKHPDDFDDDIPF